MPKAPKPKAQDVKPEVTPEVETETTPNETAPAPEQPAKVEKPKVEVRPTLANVVNTSGQVVRTYTLADHGENFLELAQEFAGKRGYSVK
jgi:hypothetical protein